MKTFRKTLALLLAFMMLVSVLPTNFALAEGNSVTESVDNNYAVTEPLDSSSYEEPSNEESSSDVSSDTSSAVEEAPASDFEYEIVDGEVTITEYTGSATELIIPSYIEGYPVTSIADYAFDVCPNLISITIPNGVKNIGVSAFSSCNSLTNVTIGNGLISMGDFAFYSCYRLASITIPDSLTSIGGYAFDYCYDLSDVWYSGSADEKEGINFNYGNDYLICANWHYDFDGTFSEPDVDIEEAPASDFEYEIVDGEVAITGYYGSAEILVIPSYIDGYPVTSIRDNAFNSYSTLITVTIPDSVTSISSDAFRSCENLESITLGNHLEIIGSYAFSNCYNLANVTIPDSVTRIEYMAFWGSGLNNIHIPANVEFIGEAAFSGCSELTSITVDSENSAYHSQGNCLINTESKELIAGCSTSVIPDDESVTRIGYQAFVYCTNLDSIVIPDCVTVIEERAFDGCSSLRSVNIPESIEVIEYLAFGGCALLTDISLPEGLKTISDSAFAQCGLSSIHIPASLECIGSAVFSGCNNLVSITVDPDNNTYRSQDNCLIVTESNELVAGCTTSIIPDGVIAIVNSAFAGLSDLAGVIIPDSVTRIGDSAFYDCSSLEAVILPSGITNIGANAFDWCKSLSDVWYRGSTDDKEGIYIDYSNDYLLNSNWHYNTCKIDEHSYENACDATCNNCEWEREAADHVYTDACDVDCNQCGEVREAPHYYATNDCEAPCSLCNGVDTVRGHKAPSVTVDNDSEYPFNLNDGIYNSINTGDSSSATMTLTGRGTVTIDYKTSTEQNYDELIITKNDVLLVEASGESDWAQVTVELTEGDIVRISYRKDGSVSNGMDTVWFKLSGVSDLPLEELEAGCEDILCVNCKEVLLEGTGHSYSNDSDTSCDTCGAIRKIYIKLNTPTAAVIENFSCAKFYFTPEESGMYHFYSTSDYDLSAYLCDSYGNRILYDDESGEGNNFRLECNLTAGATYCFETYAYSESATFEVTLKKFESPVASVTVEPVKIMENSKGYFTTNRYWDDELEDEVLSPEYYCYSDIQPQNCTITLKNGETYNNSFEWDGQWYYISYGNYQSYENRWTVGNTYTVEASIAGYEFTYTVEIIESPVASVTTEDKVYRENTNGWWTESEIYNEETDSWERVEYFRYDTDPGHCTITLKNGETFNGSGFYWNGQWYGATYSNDQNYHNRWTPGNTYTVTANLAGYYFTYDITIAEYSADDNFEYMTTDDGVIISDMFSYSPTVEIPAEIGGSPVIGVVSLGNSSVVKNLIFPDSVKTIGDYVIESFWNLETVTFGKEIRNLTPQMFYWSDDLESITVSEDNKYFTTIDGVLFDKDVTKVIAYPVQKGSSYVVPDTVSDISIFSMWIYSGINISFSENNAYFVTVDGVTYTADMTRVLYCDKNKSGVYVMPETVTEIDGKAFDNCKYLTEVVVSPLVTEIVYFTFASCYNLESVDLPEGLVSIEESAFADTYSLTSIELPETLEVIGTSTFYNSGLESLKVPDSVKRIGSSAFNNTDIATLDLGNGIQEIDSSAFANTPLTALNIPASLTYIGWYAFTNTKITSLIIPDTVLELGGGAFANCSLLSSVTIGKGLSEISDYLFENTALTSVEFPDNITRIGWYAFCNTPLTALNITPYIVEIEWHAFANTKITSLVIPDTLTYLGSHAFENCAELKTLTIGSGLSEIYDWTFANTGLTSVVIPENIEAINVGAFANSKLEEVVFENPAVEIGSAAFMNCPLKELNLGNQLETIYPEAFAGADITEIVIPDSVTSIMYSAFKDCENLIDIEMPTSVMHLGRDSFDNTAWYNTQHEGNTYLNHIAYKYKGTMPEDTHLGLRDGTLILADNAFIHQSGLTSVSLPDGLKGISAEAFSLCYNLESVYIPKSVEYINNSAFYECYNLTDIWYEGSEEDFENITIYYNNYYLEEANWHFNSENEHVHNYVRYLEEQHPHKVYYVCDSCCDGYYTDETDSLDGCLGCEPAHEHNYNEVGFDGKYHWNVCACGDADVSSRTAHNFDNDCDTGCNDCDYERTVSHNYDNVKFDDENHWMECDCGEIDEDTVYEHGYSRYTDEDNHWLQCHCGHIIESEPHDFDNACDTVCDECKYERVTADHVYDNDCDTNCNECGHFRLPFGPYAPTFTVESVTGKTGNTITVAVKTKNNPGIAGLKLSIGYDSDILEFVGGQQQDFDKGMFSISPVENNPISIVWNDTALVTEDGTIALLTFLVKDDAELGETDITVSYDLAEVFNENLEPVAFAMEDGVVNVVSYVSGDVNEDGVINNIDLALLLRYVSDWDVEIDELAADVNRDGIINNLDLAILLRYVSDWDVELK